MVIFTLTCLVPFIQPSFQVPPAKEFEARAEESQMKKTDLTQCTARINEISKAKDTLLH